MVEKKLIACSILAIAIGIAAIVPLEYMMAVQAQENAQQANTALPKVEPLLNGVGITYAYCNPNKITGNATMTLYGANIQVVANFTLNVDALDNADAQIEYYKFAVSSDEGPILNMGYYVVVDFNPYSIVGIGGSEGTINFANGLTFKGPRGEDQEIYYDCGGQAINYEAWPSGYTMGFVSKYIFATDPNNLPQAAVMLKNAQTLYIDVSKICTVTVKGNVTVTTPATDQILQHIELTNIGSGFGFVYGAYANEIPFPVEGPQAGLAPMAPSS
ncbi:MAG: hypothetical protein NWE94_10460 [Candidatus Bathyarchaeota archaeon]|nr:hypothetical protein [Candidatus Bathyarchaeota archaeon]